MSDKGNMNTLDILEKKVLGCTDCPLAETRTIAVPGEGSIASGAMFVGEAPGFHEDQQGRPFVGPAGKFLDQLLNLAGLNREDVYITNVVKCRPPSNRDPFPSEIQACQKYLDRQIELLQPRVIISLGRHSLSHFLPKELISKCHGQPRERNGLTVYPMYHPAAALHQQALRSVIETDMKRLPEILSEVHTNSEKGTEEQQLNMF